MALNSNYPYTSGTWPYSTGSCKSFTVYGGDISSWSYATTPCSSGSCSKQDEDTLISNLYNKQPVSVCLDAAPWNDYTRGVMTNANSGCSSSAYAEDHCVQLTGYNGYGTTSGYYLVRNSWGTDWGYSGYIYLSIGGNTCGIANDATQVTIA